MSSAAVKLSCEECRRRKTKCDKGSPCSACKNAGITCTAVQRARLPRGRSGKARNRGSTLENRVAQLEGLVRQLEAQVTSSGEDSSTDFSNTSVDSDRSHLPPVPQKAAVLVARDFFTALSEEVAGIRETLEFSDEEDSLLQPTNPIPKTSLDSAQSSANLLFGHYPQCLDDDMLEPPSEQFRQKLLDLYRDRVDCVFKATFWPAAFAAIRHQYASDEDHSYSASIKALEGAMYFMAICTLREDECQPMFGDDKHKLIRKYRTVCEVMISRAQLLQNPDKLVLQSFVIYLLALRTCMQYSTCWTLLATAVRVANAMGIPNKMYTDQVSIGDELKLRLWYCIGMLDTITAQDRGIAPMTSIDDFQRTPLIVNDSEMTGSVPPSVSSSEYNNMSFSYLIYEATRCSRNLLTVRSTANGSWADWDEKLRHVAVFEDRIRQHCAQLSGVPHPFARYIQHSAVDVVLNIQLILRRPPYRSKTNPAPPWDNFDVMRCTTEILELDLKLVTDKEIAPWAWFSKSWVKWYALAVLLAELCAPRCEELTERAYMIAKDTYDRYLPFIVDTDLSSLWKPISKLMRRVEGFRALKMNSHQDGQQMLQHSMEGLSTEPSATDGTTNNIMANSSAPTGDQSLSGQYGGYPVQSFQAPLFPVLNHNDEVWQANTDDFSATDNVSWLNWDNFLGDVNGAWDLHEVF